MVVLFRLLSRKQFTGVFSKLDSLAQELLLKEVSDERIKDIVSELSTDDRTELFEELPGSMSQKLINLLSPEERKRALEILGYPEDSVGRLITPDYIAVKPYWDVEHSLDHIRTLERMQKQSM